MKCFYMLFITMLMWSAASQDSWFDVLYRPMSTITLPHGQGDANGLRVLMVTVDNRPLQANLSSDEYVSKIAVLNKNYADRHGYDYLYVFNDVQALFETLHMSEPKDRDGRHGIGVYHTDKHFGRASSWSKVLGMWYIVQRYGNLYDYVMLLDSDLGANPLRAGRSISDALADWQQHNATAVNRGIKDVRSATFLFGNNFPWRNDLPCAGWWLVRTSRTAEAQVAHAAALLREWWDADVPAKRYVDFLEQDTLWHILQAPASSGFGLSFDTSVSLLSEFFFLQMHYKPALEDLWMAHVPSYELNRVPFIRTLLHWASPSLHNSSTFAATIANIHQTSMLKLDFAQASKWLEHTPSLFSSVKARAKTLDNNGKIGTKEKKQPAVLAASSWSIDQDNAWANETNKWWQDKWRSGLGEWRKIDPEMLYNNCMIRMSDHPGDIYFVHKNKLRYVAESSLKKLGYVNSLVINFDVQIKAYANVAMIPKGKPIGTKELKKALKKLRKA